MRPPDEARGGRACRPPRSNALRPRRWPRPTRRRLRRHLAPRGDRRHARRAVRRRGLQHRLNERPYRSVDVGKVGNDAALLDDVDLRAAHVDRPPAQGLREDQAETVDVRLERDLAAGEADLLGRDVVVLAGETVADDRALARPMRTRDAEIDDLGAPHVAVGQNDVVRGNVAVDDAETMRRLERAADALLQDPDLGERQRP